MSFGKTGHVEAARVFTTSRSACFQRRIALHPSDLRTRKSLSTSRRARLPEADLWLASASLTFRIARFPGLGPRTLENTAYGKIVQTAMPLTISCCGRLPTRAAQRCPWIGIQEVIAFAQETHRVGHEDAKDRCGCRLYRPVETMGEIRLPS